MCQKQILKFFEEKYDIVKLSSNSRNAYEQEFDAETMFTKTVQLYN